MTIKLETEEGGRPMTQFLQVASFVMCDVTRRRGRGQ